jgi:hypothetical protein
MHQLQRRPDARLPIAPPYSPRVVRPAPYDPRVRPAPVLSPPPISTPSTRSLGIGMAIGVAACVFGSSIGMQALRDFLVWMLATNERLSEAAFASGVWNVVRMICVLAFGVYVVYLAGTRLLDDADGASSDSAATPAER